MDYLLIYIPKELGDVIMWNIGNFEKISHILKYYQ